MGPKKSALTGRSSGARSTRTWSRWSFHPEDAGRILVDVHQVVRDLGGVVLADEHVGHRFTIEQGLIQAMEVCSLPSSDHSA